MPKGGYCAGWDDTPWQHGRVRRRPRNATSAWQSMEAAARVSKYDGSAAAGPCVHQACGKTISSNKAHRETAALNQAHCTTAVEAAAEPVCKFNGIDFTAAGCEQRVTFVDTTGKSRNAYVYLPSVSKDAREGWPTVVYIHGLGWESPLIESSRTHTAGMQVLMESCVVVSPIIGLKDRDAYFDTEKGLDAITWVAELVQTLLHGGLEDDWGQQWVDPYRVSVTGVSLGGGVTYVIGSMFGGTLSCVAPIAAYHDSAKRRELAEGLSQLPVYCVHSTSHTERTCPIKDEEELWTAIHNLGGNLQVERVQCKHGKTFNHAYEIGDWLWRWILEQRRSVA